MRNASSARVKPNIRRKLQIRYQFRRYYEGKAIYRLHRRGNRRAVYKSTISVFGALPAVSSISSLDSNQEILLCKAISRNEFIARCVFLYLNHYGYGRKYCREQATYLVQIQDIPLQHVGLLWSVH
ncbi:uncharacterized protein LOC112092504 [Morus notabilis]|uniref:uncharacterized protein LOC112092504 n=1 Tax=Morus notabilis TaxID=981085 RepID=UPI000CECE888|nr:uncharacterized protein LOC112092504 [Morus notabilis]